MENIQKITQPLFTRPPLFSVVKGEERSVEKSGGIRNYITTRFKRYHSSTLQLTNLQPSLCRHGFWRLERRNQSRTVLLEGHTLDNNEARASEGGVEQSLPSETTSAASTSFLETESNGFLEADNGVSVHNEGFVGSEFLINE